MTKDLVEDEALLDKGFEDAVEDGPTPSTMLLDPSLQEPSVQTSLQSRSMRVSRILFSSQRIPSRTLPSVGLWGSSSTLTPHPCPSPLTPLSRPSTAGLRGALSESKSSWFQYRGRKSENIKRSSGKLKDTVLVGLFVTGDRSIWTPQG